MGLADLVILSLAAWRVSHMVAREVGPFAAFERLRLLFGAKYSASSDAWFGTSVLAQLVTCPLCLSVWVGLALVLARRRGPIGDVAVGALAVSGAASALELAVGSR